MSKIKLYCINKVRNSNGKIVEYVIGDEYGDTGNFDKDGVIGLIKDAKYDLTNLQLDSLGRLVDKAIPNESKLVEQINKRSQSKDIYVIFDRAYGFIQKMGLVMIVRDSNGNVKLTEPFDNLPNTINIDELMNNFENYISKKYGIQLTKLDVTNINDNSRFVQYGLQYVEYTYLNDQDFKKIDNIKNFKIACNVSSETHQMCKKVNDNDDFLGVIVYDKRDKAATDWANTRLKELEKATSKFKSNGKGKTPTKKGKTTSKKKDNSIMSLFSFSK